MQVIIEDYVHDDIGQADLADGQHLLRHRRRPGGGLRHPQAFVRIVSMAGRSATNGGKRRARPPSTAAPIRSKITPMTSSSSAPAARACAPWSAAAKRACAPPASPRCFRPARIPSRRRAASPPRSAIWARTTGAGTCTTPSRGPTGSATRTPSNICAATRRTRSTSWSIGACRSRAARKTARSISARSAA